MATFPFFDSGIASAFDAMQEQMERLLRGAGPRSTLRGSARAGFPPINVGVCPGSVEVVAFMPGVEPEALKVSIDKGVLTISGERKAEEAPAGATFYARERASGSFTRVVELPQDADPDQVGARYVDGCLRVSIKRKEASQPRVIAVQ
ncbi:Hsp20/alpha crystallin family protein [Achromobacter sp. Marseille-Q4962]|uniref:Hsp20/alpha crystallin family protein n=1 Tax=Achromobacter sp. Marseille-Q4962 TaxID=2942202 RepID=UPI0020740B62|nr:Hsp20/alpha crystallin family protein [Achromobacter sp. Marseille-Q4962]